LENAFAVFISKSVDLEAEVGGQVDTKGQLAHFGLAQIRCRAAEVFLDHLVQLLFELLHQLAKALLNVAHHIIILLGQITNVLPHSAVAVRSEFQIGAENLGLVNQVVLSHHRFDFVDHRTHNSLVDFLEVL